MYGKHHSEEWRQKISNANRGERNPNYGKRGIETSNYGKHFSKEHRQKISEAVSKALYGKKHPHQGHPILNDARQKISKAQRGRIVSEETRKKISQKNKGRTFSEEHRKKISEAHCGKRLVAEHKKKISDANRGEKGNNWRGGISFEPYCPKFNKEFKERVRAFFGYECVECHTPQNGRKLDVHHINYNKMMCCNDVKPLFVALCRSHNSLANKNREYWEQHFTQIINEQYGGKCYLPKASGTIPAWESVK